MSQAGQGLGGALLVPQREEPVEKPVEKRTEFPAICSVEKPDASTQTHHPSCSENGPIGLVLKAGD